MKLFRNPSSLAVCAHKHRTKSLTRNPIFPGIPSVHSEQSLQQVQGVPPASSRPLNKKSSAGNGDVIAKEFSDWVWRVWSGCVTPWLDPHTLLRTQESSCRDHPEDRMPLSRALILGVLALTTVLSRCGGEDDIEGELCS